MARSRTIKPGFFDNEHLAECSAQARLLFIATWMLADRDGYFENRPLRIRKFAFGYGDNVDIPALLVELEEHELICKVDPIGSQAWFLIPAFSAHQSPHVKEPARYLSGASPGAIVSDKSGASLGQVPDKSGTGVNSKQETVNSVPETVEGEQKTRARFAPSTLADLFTEILPELPQPDRPLADGIKERLRAAINRDDDPDSWRAYFASIRSMPYLMGKKADWIATITWLTGPKNYAKVKAGEYFDHTPPPRPEQGSIAFADYSKDDEDVR